MDYRTPVDERLPELQRLLTAAPKQKVTILGAGMAGLAAATELVNCGHQVRVLEASGRAGGRVHTWRPDGEHHHEFGAMRIPLAHDYTRHYIASAGLALREFVTAYKDADAWLDLRGRRFRMKEAGNHVPELFDLSSTNRAKVREIVPGTPEESRTTVEAVLMNQVLGPIMDRITPDDERALLLEGEPTTLSTELESMTWGELVTRSLHTSDEVDLVGLSTMTDVWWHACPTFFVREEMLKAGPPFDELEQGTDQLPREMAAKLGDAITYHRAVTGIELIGGRVRLTTRPTVAGGRDGPHVDWGVDAVTEDHDLVLCTIPFSVLRGMDLIGFSPQKMAAIRLMNYESSSKVMLLCKQRRWEEDPTHAIIGGGSLSDSIVRSIYYPSDHVPVPAEPRPTEPTGETIYRVQRPRVKPAPTAAADSTEPGVLVASYSWGRDARRMGAMPHNQRVETCLRVLDRIHPGIRNDVEDLETDTASICWDNHPWARGAFALPHANETPVHFENARKPEGGLYFAGEHLSFDPAWIQGAIISALVAVEAMFTS